MPVKLGRVTPTNRRFHGAVLIPAAATGVALAIGYLMATRSRGDTRGRDVVWSSIVSVWRGAPVLSGQSNALCDSIVVARPQSHCGVVTETIGALPQLAAIAAELQRSTTPDSRRQLALIDLATSPPAATVWNRVLTAIDEAAAMDDADASIFSDQAALHLQRFAEAPVLVDLIVALDAATHATELAPDSWHACHNRSVALAWAGLRNLARIEWSRCSTLRTAPAGRQRPTLIDNAFTSGEAASRRGAHLLEAEHDHAWRDLLPQWARHRFGSAPESAAVVITKLQLIGTRLEDSGVDSGVGSAVREIARAEAERDMPRLRRLALGFRLYGEVRSDPASRNLGLASARLDSARRTADPADPLIPLLGLEQAIIIVRSGNLRRAIDAYSGLWGSLSSPLLRSRAMRGRAASYGALGSPLDALSEFDRAELSCIKAELEECALAAPAMSAQMAGEAGDLDDAERRALRAVQALASVDGTSWVWSTSYLMRRLADRSDRQWATRSFDDEALRIARQLKRPDLAAQTVIAAVRSHLDRKAFRAAAPLLTELELRWIPQLGEADLQFAQVNALAFRGELARQSEPDASVELLDSALVLQAGHQNEFRRTPLRIARARARLALGDTTAMLEELTDVLSGLRRLDKGRESVFTQARISVLSSEIADLTAQVLRARGDAVGALRALSEARFIKRDDTGCCDAAGALTLAVRHMSDSLWIWERSGGSWTLRSVRLSAPDIAASARLDPAMLSRIGRLLFNPMARKRVPTSVCIDARGLPSRIPWSALRPMQTNEYLVELSVVRLVASALDPCGAQTAWRMPRAVHLIAGGELGGPRALPGAAGEIDRLSSIWATGATTTHTGADASRILAETDDADLLHFSGHAVLDRDRPERSYLLIPSHVDSALSGSRIQLHSFRRKPVVILAACETRGSSLGPGGGFDSLAGAFLTAGASVVIGTGWPVEDTPTAYVMRALHTALHRGAPPAIALREAQLLAIQSGDPTLASPRVWAAFQFMENRR